MIRYILLFFLFFSVSGMFSQYHYPKKEYAKKVLNSTLIVELLEGDHETITHMNNSIKDVFTNHWKHTDVLFMTEPQIDSLVSKHRNGYAILYQNDFEYNENRKGHINSDGSFGFGTADVGTGQASRRYTAFTFSYYSCYLNIRINGKNHFVTSVGFGNGELTKIDYMFLYQQMSRLIEASAAGKSTKEYFDVKRNLKKLESSTLMLPKFFFKEKDHSKIDKYYKYKYKLVDADEYQKVILNKEPGKAYVKIIWSHQHKLYMWIVVNAENGAILAITGFGGVQFGTHHTANDIIKAKHLKYVTSKFAQKFNNRYGWKLFGG